MLQGHGWGAGQLASVLVTPTMGRGDQADAFVVYPGRRLDFAGNGICENFYFNLMMGAQGLEPWTR
jgi:hypothetical protein